MRAVPPSGLIAGCLAVMAGFTHSASMLRCVRVESCVYEIFAGQWVVVCDGGEGYVAEDANGIACEYCGSEGLMPCAGIPTVAGCPSTPVGLTPVGGASAALTGWVDCSAPVD